MFCESHRSCAEGKSIEAGMAEASSDSHGGDRPLEDATEMGSGWEEGLLGGWGMGQGVVHGSFPFPLTCREAGGA